MSAKTTTCWRPFSDKSPWNTRIPANPAIDSRSGIMINDLSLCSCKGKIGMNINEWSIPVFYVDDKTTRWSEINYSYAKKFCHPHLLERAPIPKHAKPDPQGDAHLCIINESRTKSWDFWALKKYEGKWLARSARGFDLRGTGVLKPGRGRMPCRRLSAHRRPYQTRRNQTGDHRARPRIRVQHAKEKSVRSTREQQ